MIEDPLLRRIARLPAAESDRGRAGRVRERCHAALARQRRQEEVQPARSSAFWPLVAALGGVYITETIRQALLLYGIL
jgi:hypothetical protein